MKIKLIDYGAAETGYLPKRADYSSVGADVRASRAYTVPPGKTAVLGLGFGIQLPDGMAGYVFPRSSLAAKGVVCQLPPIDPGYTGEIHAVVTNHGPEPFVIAPGQRIGQLVVMPYIGAEFIAGKLESRRGARAFGSTGE
ncbi:MAG: deoxyuridine 5'-triphosphate nucleotidohydrolase [Oscillospiraceae bacterium]|jgi:dUTP pyrophosphatase|nr:deoxyuridine 5'-triphosphate nucleotidohydrolase [Oscillospiraceae bacterium]